jgi:hypothetical protein
MVVILRFLNYLGVRSCYDEGKRTAETLTMDYHRGPGVEVCFSFFTNVLTVLLLWCDLNVIVFTHIIYKRNGHLK